MKNKKHCKVKYENIITILYVIYSILQVRHHILLNGVYNGIYIEIIYIILFTCMIHYIVKNIRLNK